MSSEERAELGSRMSDNLLSISASASSETVSAGVGWYRLARREARGLSRAYGVTERASAGVISALSPRVSWLDNLRRAGRLLETGERVGIGTHSDRALEIRGGGRPLSILRGPKTRAFYRNITGDLESSITIDTWMMRALLGDLELSEAGVKALGRVGAYELAESSTRAASVEYSREAGVVIRPAEYQALIWLETRELARRRRAEEKREMIEEARRILGPGEEEMNR